MTCAFVTYCGAILLWRQGRQFILYACTFIARRYSLLSTHTVTQTEPTHGIALLKFTVDPSACRFPGTKASYHALLDVVDNELTAGAQARQAAMRLA